MTPTAMEVEVAFKGAALLSLRYAKVNLGAAAMSYDQAHNTLMRDLVESLVERLDAMIEDAEMSRTNPMRRWQVDC